jgi:tetratricopeptide (TPR) repeat protein
VTDEDKAEVARIAVALLQALPNWDQATLSKESGIHRSQISSYLSGKVVPRPKNRRRLAAAVNVQPPLLAHIESFLSELLITWKSGLTGSSAAAVAPPPSPAEESARAAGLVAQESAQARAELALLSGRRPAPPVMAPSAADHPHGEALWQRLEPFSARERLVIVKGVRAFNHWALAVRLCAESEEVAPDSAVEALELAELARVVARLAAVPETWRPCLEGYTAGLVANAHRAGGRLNPADVAYTEALALWEKGDSGEPGLLDAGRLFDLGASLRRDQRRFAEALALHEQALALTPQEESGSKLLNQAVTFEQSGDYERAITTLAEAALWVDGTRKPRLLFALRFNLAVNLVHLENAEEAERLVPEIQALTLTFNKESDRIRLRWLEGKIAAGLGRREEAIPALEQVRQWFAAKDNPYDMALATLELAALYLEEGHTAKVKELVLEMAPIFKAQKVPREALAALTLFRDAALQETATAALARRLVRYLTEARHDPERQFEG